LRDQLIVATHGNFIPGPALDDVGPIREVLKVLPLDRVVMVVRQKVDRRCYPANPPLVSWRDLVLLRAFAEDFCRTFAIPRLVKEWNETGRAPATKAQSSPPAAALSAAVDVPTPAPASAADAAEAPAAVQAPPEEKNASTVLPSQPAAIPNGKTPEVEPTAEFPSRIDPGSRDAVLGAFARKQALQPASPQPRPQRQAAPAEPEIDEISDEFWDDAVAAFRMGNLSSWPRRPLGEPLGHPNCKVPVRILRKDGL
jgi:hypothetical protein